MRFPQPYTLKQIADILQIEFVGDANFLITGCNEIHRVTSGDIVFVDHPKYYNKALESAATTILINKAVDCPKGKALLISEDPFSDFNKLTKLFKPFAAAQATIASSAKIGINTIIQPGAFIGNNVSIGNNSLIHANVSIYDDCIIGSNVTIHANTVIGADAFYYKKRKEGFDKLLSSGNVIIEDNVDLGAACTIDRGVSAPTIIGKGSKLDNQVHIGHDTIIGRDCLIASQTGIAGCVVIGNEVTIWGQVGIKSDVTLADKTEIYAQSGLGQNTQVGKAYFGSPAIEARAKFKEMAVIKKIPSLIEKIDKL